MLMQQEVGNLTKGAGFYTDPYFPYIIGLWVLLSPFLSNPLVTGLALFLLFVGLQIYKEDRKGVSSLITTFFTGLYAPVGLLALLLVRGTGSEVAGFTLTLSLLLMIWGNDVQQAKRDRKSTRLNSSHVSISYAVF